MWQDDHGRNNKDDKNKKRRQEKEQRKEERRANSNKGKGLDSMLAWVDENGNLSDVPPDPNRKTEIKLEDILVGAAPRDRDPEDNIRKGVIAFFNDAKGFGFINDKKTGERIFVHVSQLAAPVKENDLVTYDVERSPKGLNAVRVRKL